MNIKVFLSHNYNDKQLVEPVALKLSDIIGRDRIFYDSWSIRPGDGIIDKMNEGLDAPEFVFFFVSRNSLQSGMVKLEWQNALYSATKGKCRLIPVRLDDSEMPAVLKQSLFIDMYTIGLDAAISQIVSVVQGDVLFEPSHKGFSNLTYGHTSLADGTVEVTVYASHMMEPNPNFAFPVMNEEVDLSWWIKGHPGIQGMFRSKAFQLNEGGLANAVIMRPIVGSLVPKHPLTFEFRKRGPKDVNLIDVLHDQGDDQWVRVPPKAQ